MDTVHILKPVTSEGAMAFSSSTCVSSSCSVVSSDNLYCTGTSNDSSALQSPVSTGACGGDATVFGSACTVGMVSPSFVPFRWEEAPGKPALDSWKKQNTVHLQLPPKMTAHQQLNEIHSENQHSHHHHHHQQQQQHQKLHKLQSQKLVKACKSLMKASSWISPTSLQLLRCHRSTGSFSTTGQITVVSGSEDDGDDEDNDAGEAGRQEHSRLSLIAARNQKLMKLCKSMLRINSWSNPLRSLQYHVKQNQSEKEKTTTTTTFRGIRHYVWAKKLRVSESHDKQGDLEIGSHDMNIHKHKLLQGVHNGRFFFDKAGPLVQYDEVSEADNDDLGDHDSYAQWKSFEAERLVQSTAHGSGSPEALHERHTIDSSLVQGRNGSESSHIQIHGTYAVESSSIQGRRDNDPSLMIGTHVTESSSVHRRHGVDTSVVQGRFTGSESSPIHEKYVDDPSHLKCITEHQNKGIHLPIQPELQDRIDKWLSNIMVYYSFQDLTQEGVTHNKKVSLSDLTEEEEEEEEHEEKNIYKRPCQIPVTVKQVDSLQFAPATDSEMHKINAWQPHAIKVSKQNDTWKGTDRCFCEPLQNKLNDGIYSSAVHPLGDAIKFDESPPGSPESWEHSLKFHNGQADTSQSVSEDTEINDPYQSSMNLKEQQPQGSPVDLCEMTTNVNHSVSTNGCLPLLQNFADPLELNISTDTYEKEFYSMEVHNGGVDDVSDGRLSFCSSFPNRENTFHRKKVQYSSDFDSPMGSIWVSDFSVEDDVSSNHASNKMVKILSYKRFKSFLSRVGDVSSPFTRRVSRVQDGCAIHAESQPSSPWISSLGPSGDVNKSSKSPKINKTSFTKLKNIMVSGMVKVKVRIHKKGGAYKETEIWSPTLATYLYNQQMKDNNMSSSEDDDNDDSKSFKLHLDRIILSSTRGHQLNPYNHAQFVDTPIEGASEVDRRGCSSVIVNEHISQRKPWLNQI